MILDGMLKHIKNGSPFLMYPRFIQVFLNKQLEGVPNHQDFLLAIILPDKVFTFMSTQSGKFSGRITPLTAHMLEVAQAVRNAAGSGDDTAHSASEERTASQHTEHSGPQPIPSPPHDVSQHPASI